MGKNILEMRSIEKSFGKTHALRGIHFEVEEGEVHALLGENGAGKSTLIKVLGGIHQPDSGTISIDGQEVHLENVSQAQARGIGIIHQEIVLVPALTIAENIFLGREPATRLGLRDVKSIQQRAAEMMAALGLTLDVTTPVRKLTIAQQQMVEIVKAISFNVKILVMDEPTSSLSEEEVQKLFEIIRTLKGKGVSIIYISHRMAELFEVSDRVTVIRDGAYVGTRETARTNADELVAMMVGRSLESYYVRTFTTPGDVMLTVEHLTRDGVFEDISFQVRKGEIVGFSGLVGAGRSEVMAAIFGGTPFDSGVLRLNGKQVRFQNTAQAIRHGVGMVPEDRKKMGLALVNTVGFNLTLAAIRSLVRGGLINRRARKAMIDRSIHDYRIKTASPDASVASLSGGNQQKVVIAKWLASSPSMLILDEPTRGVDVGAKQEIYAIMNGLAAKGMAIVMVSSDLPEIINMCDRVYVMRAGRLVAELSREQITQENIMRFATGGEVLHA